MKTIEREEAGIQTRTRFEPRDVLKQVVIAALAVAPDGESIVYVKRTVEDGKYARRLWRTTFDGGRPEQLTSAKASDQRPRFSPDGRRLVFISDRSGKPQAWVINLSGGEPRQVTDLPGGVGAADWSPDGSRLLLLGGSGEKRFLVGDPDDPIARAIRDYTWRFDGVGVRDEYTSVWVTEVDEPKPRRITDPHYYVSGAAWSPDGARIAFLADRSETHGLEEIDSVWSIDAHGGEPQQVARLAGGTLNVAWAPGRDVVFLGLSHEGSPGWADVELHVGGRRLAADRHLNIQPTSYGDYMDGDQFGQPPLIYEDDENLLALVGHHGYSHPYRFGVNGKVEALATPEAMCSSIAAGGGRVAVNAATSDGPNEVCAVEDGEGVWCGPDGSDLLRLIDWAADELKIADREKIGIMGLSYGGFMTNWMIANHPGVFAAAVSENPVTDMLGEWATSDFGRYIGRRAAEKQNAWESIDAFLARSPFVKIHQNKAPLLLLHAENDMRCPPGQSEMVFHILRTLGREVELVRYPAETHIMLAIGRPDRRVDRIERIVGWFTTHLGADS